MIAQAQTALEPKRGLDRFAETIVHFVPDAITASVILLIVLACAAFSFGHSGIQVMDAYYRGLWMLLPFTMQMTLIVVLSAALSATPIFRDTVARLAAIPKTRNQVITLAVLLTACAGYCYWGLGLTLGPVIAVYFAREAERKGIRIDFPFLLANVYAGNAVWQFGLSATAPLVIATPNHFLQDTIGVIPLARTIWSPAALIHVVVYTAVIIVAGWRLMPRMARPISLYPESLRLTEAAVPASPDSLTLSERIERKPFFMYLLSGVLFAWLWYHFAVKGLSLDINALNTTLLLLSLLLHRNFRSFTAAVEKAAVSGWPVIVLYHLYAGLAGLIQFTTVGERLATAAASVSNAYTLPLLTAVIATIFSFFIPSSGGQWAIQGFVTVKSAAAVGLSVERGLLAMSVGDHMGNLSSPFWYVIAAGIARVDFRTIFGYGLLFAGLWFVIGVVVFTFAPC